MTYKRLIPKIVVVKSHKLENVVYRSILTRGYQPYRVIGNPLRQQRILQDHVVDEIILINKRSNGSFGRDDEFESFLSDFCSTMVTPLTVGGGIKTFDHAKYLFSLGVDRVLVSQIGLERSFVKKVIDSYGSQAISFSFDYQEHGKSNLDELKRQLFNFLEEGFGEVILNNTSRDGTAIGLDHLLLKEISKTVGVPIVIGCGAMGVADIAAAFKMGADGVSTSTFLSTTDQSPKQIRAHLHSMGINIRVSK